MTTTDTTTLEEAAGQGGFDPDTFKFKRYNWLRMARLSGEEGDRWVTQFMTTPLPKTIVLAEKALDLLRRNEKERGRAILEHVCKEIDDLEAAGDELPLIVPKRWSLGIEAYIHYLDRRYDEALETLDRAGAVVKEVLETYSFLKDLALAGKDFAVQRARVARNQRDWRAMERHLQEARGMVADEVPLFVLADGTEIFVGTVVDHYRRSRLNAQERQALEFYFNTRRSLFRFDTQTSRIGIPSGLIVPYH